MMKSTFLRAFVCCLCLTFGALYLAWFLSDTRRASICIERMHPLQPASTRARAREQFRNLGTNSIPFLLHELQDHCAPVHSRLLVRFFSVEDTQQQVQRSERLAQIVYAFSVLGSNAVPALPQLTAMLDDPSLSPTAAAAIITIGPTAIPNAMTALTNRVIESRCIAANGLGSFGRIARAAVPALLYGAGTGSQIQRITFIKALGDIGECPTTVAPALLTWLNETSDPISAAAAQALTSFDMYKTITITNFLNRAKTAHAYYQRDIACAAFKLDSERSRRELIPVLTNQLSSPMFAVRDATVTTLMHFSANPDSYSWVLEELLNDTNFVVRQYAAKLLQESSGNSKQSTNVSRK